MLSAESWASCPQVIVDRQPLTTDQRRLRLMAFDNRRTPTWKMHVASLSCGVALLTILCIGPILNHSLEWVSTQYELIPLQTMFQHT